MNRRATARPEERAITSSDQAGRPVNGQPTSPEPTFEYVVRWRRADWSITTKTKSRKFDRAQHAQEFVRKLQNPDGDWSELSPAIIRVDRRPVGPWELRFEWDGRP